MTPDLDEAVAHALSECIVALRDGVSPNGRALARRLALLALDRMRAEGGERVPVGSFPGADDRAQA